MVQFHSSTLSPSVSFEPPYGRCLTTTLPPRGSPPGLDPASEGLPTVSLPEGICTDLPANVLPMVGAFGPTAPSGRWGQGDGNKSCSQSCAAGWFVVYLQKVRRGGATVGWGVKLSDRRCVVGSTQLKLECGTRRCREKYPLKSYHSK